MSALSRRGVNIPERSIFEVEIGSTKIIDSGGVYLVKKKRRLKKMTAVKKITHFALQTLCK